MKRVLLGVLLCLSMVTPAQALEKGESALGDDRIMAIHPGGASAFLYDDRIVFANAHALFDENGKLRPLSFWGALGPGTKTWSQKTYPKIVKVFIAEGYAKADWRINWTAPNDFAILILDRPIANVPKAKLATVEMMNSFRESGATVTTGGYGFQSEEDRARDRLGKRGSVEPMKATLQMATGNYIDAAVATVISGHRLGNTKEPFPSHLQYHLLSPYDGPGTCDGDSGSGFYIRQERDVLYLGTIGAHLGITNCGVEKPIPGFVPLIGINPVFRYFDLVEEAESWVRKNPAPIKVRPKSLLISNYKGEQTQISSLQLNKLEKSLKTMLGFSKIQCIGYSTNKAGSAIAKARATSVCEKISTLYSDYSTSVTVNVTSNRSLVSQVKITLRED